MARFLRLDVLNKMIELGVVPVFYNRDVKVTKQIVAACSRGGAKVVEFTNRGDFAYQVFGELVQHFQKTDPEVILGVGSVCDPGTAALYINNGANFVVGPVTNPDVARICNRRKIAYSPGCGSASEISYAEELGVEIVKVFAGAQVGGPGVVKAVLGPRESIEAWFRAGVACVGIGSKLITKEQVARGDFDGIAANVAHVLAWIREVRADMA